MSFGTHALIPVYFNRESLDSKYKVQEEIDDLKQALSQLKDQFIALIFTKDFQDFMSKEDIEDGCAPADVVAVKAKELWDDIQSCAIDLYKHEAVLENWESAHKTITRNKDGEEQKVTVGLTPNDPEWWRKMYIGGDFIHEMNCSTGDVSFYDDL